MDKEVKMIKHSQRGDAGAVMLVVMAVMMIGWLWHGGGHTDRMSDVSGTASQAKTALELLDEAYARGEITREEYLRKREELRR